MTIVRKAITLSDSQDVWIKSQIARGVFTNNSEYIRDLIKRDKAQEDRLAGLRQAIAEGLDRGVSGKSLGDSWNAVEDCHRAAYA